MDATLLPTLLGIATLLPLISFFVILLSGRYLAKPAMGGYIAASAIVGAAVLSFVSMGIWLTEYQSAIRDAGHHGHHDEHHGGEHHDGEHHDGEHHDEPGHGKANEPAESHATASVEAAQWVSHRAAEEPAGDSGESADAKSLDEQTKESSQNSGPPHSGTYWVLGKFMGIEMTISYYIDSLTVCMFCMVTLIASCIHFYAMGYMHDEEAEYWTDHEVTLSDGSHLKRPGRYYRFFQYLSLFCFSMLGLVLAGNIAMVFVFWELVGACSYFLIGFYVERQSASNAANKAFITNRVGDFGMIIGLMALWAGLGTFSFGDIDTNGNGQIEAAEQGIFAKVRPASNNHELIVPDGMVRFEAQQEVRELVLAAGPDADPVEVDGQIASQIPKWRDQVEGTPGQAGFGYTMLIIAGLGIFCGCVGKSAQFPLHVWLPDAMEGPTPVSALVHSATMVAAGVYLVGRFFPAFAPEVLLVIAIVGCITLFMAATIAITATDIKRVLAYSTVSQLGYMMLALGVGGWAAGLLHLITHAFFKSLLFMCSGSVIHAVHTNEMTEMGGLRKKMPITAYTMLIGCLAIAGVSLPFVIGFSGYYSKDKILEQAFSFAIWSENRSLIPYIFFVAAAGGAAITAFYMFRLWFMTFAGKPRDPHRYDHAHESPSVMTTPLIILAVFATGVAWKPFEALIAAGVLAVIGSGLALNQLRRPSSLARQLTAGALGGAIGLVLVAALMGTYLGSYKPESSMLALLLEQSRPEGTAANLSGKMIGLVWPDEHYAHLPAQHWTIVVPVTLLATATALGGIALAAVMYAFGYLNPEEVRKQFAGVYRFLVNKWWFDELYDWLFIRPTHVVSGWIAGLDRSWIDRFIDGTATCCRAFATSFDKVADRGVVDGVVNWTARRVYATGVWFHGMQTGSLRHYIMFIVVGVVAIFLLLSFFWSSSFAG